MTDGEADRQRGEALLRQAITAFQDSAATLRSQEEAVGPLRNDVEVFRGHLAEWSDRTPPLPLHRLKIDKTFISGIPGDENDTSIVQAIIAMARQLRLRVVAEGVETEAQRAFLAANGCDEMQGYLFGMPKEADQVTALLTGQVLGGGPRATDLVVTGTLGELLDDRSA